MEIAIFSHCIFKGYVIYIYISLPVKNLKKSTSVKMPIQVTCLYTQQFLKVEIFDTRHLTNSFAIRDTIHFSSNALQNTDDIRTHTHTPSPATLKTIIKNYF